MPALHDSLYCLLYTSKLALGQDASCVRDITAHSRANNERDGITGILVFDGACFAQWLEGPLPVLEGLLGRLRRDGRHAQLRVQHHAALEGSRLFPEWRMAYALRDGEDREIARFRSLYGRAAVSEFALLLKGVERETA